MRDIEKLYTVGIDYNAGLRRFSGVQAIYEKFIVKFFEIDYISEIHNAVDNKDYLTAFNKVHTLKGTAGNMSFDSLYKKASDITEVLRDKNYENLDVLLMELDEAYEKTKNALLTDA